MLTFASFLISIVIINLASCGNGTIESSDIATTAVYRSYTVQYDQGQKELSGYARFSAGGPLETSVALSEPSMVLLNDRKMEVSDGRIRRVNFSGTYYNYSLNQSSTPRSVEIVWYTGDGDSIRDQVDIPSTFELVYPDADTVINATHDLTFDINSEKLGDEEEWRVAIHSLNNSDESETSGCCYNESFQSDKIVIRKEFLKDLPEGSAELTLTKVRTTRKDKDAYSAGALIQSKVSQTVLIKVQK